MLDFGLFEPWVARGRPGIPRASHFGIPPFFFPIPRSLGSELCTGGRAREGRPSKGPKEAPLSKIVRLGPCGAIIYRAAAAAAAGPGPGRPEPEDPFLEDPL